MSGRVATTPAERAQPPADLLALLGHRALLVAADGTVAAATPEVRALLGRRTTTFPLPNSPRCWTPCRLGTRAAMAWSLPLGTHHLVLIEDPDGETPGPVTLLAFTAQPDEPEPLVAVEPLPSPGATDGRLRPIPPELLAAVLAGAEPDLGTWLPYPGDLRFVSVGDTVVGVLTPFGTAAHPPLGGSISELGHWTPLLDAIREGVAIFFPVFEAGELHALDLVYENAVQHAFFGQQPTPRRISAGPFAAALFDSARRAWNGEIVGHRVDNRDGQHPHIARVLLDVRMRRVGDLLLGLHHDVADLAHAEGERFRAEDLLSRSLNQQPEQTCVCAPLFGEDGRLVDTRIVYSNEAAGTAIIGRLATEAFYDAPQFLAAADEAWHANTTVRYFFRHRRADDEVVFEAIVSRCGEAILSTLADRTWEQNARVALDESDRRYRITAEALPLGVALLHVPDDPLVVEPELLYVNPQLEASVASRDAVDRPMAETFPLWREYGLDLLHRAWAAVGGGVATVDIDNLDQAITAALPSCSLHLEARCSGDRAVIVVADRTREALAGREAKRAHERLRRVIGALDEAIIVLDEDQNVVLDNDAARRVLRIDGPITLAGLRALPSYDATGRRFRVGAGAMAETFRAGGAVDGMIVQIDMPGAPSRTWLRINTRTLALERGRRGVLLTAVDITDTLVAEERFRSTIDVLEEAVSLYEPVLDDTGELVDLRTLYLNPASRSFRAEATRAGALASQCFHRFEASLGVMREVWRTGRVGHQRVDNTGPDANPSLLVRLFDVTYYRTGGLLVGVAVDRTAAVDAARALARADQRFAATIEALDEELAVFEPILDARGGLEDLRILYGNRSWHAGRDDSLPADTQLLVSDYYVDSAPFLDVARVAWTGGERQRYVLENPDRAAFPQMKREHIEFSILRVGDEIVSVGLDRSVEQATLRRFRDLAAHDHDTGLLSPTGLAARLHDLLAGGSTIGLVVIEVGQLEQVQRSYGFRAADDAVRELARRLQEAAPAAPVARVGSSTFVVALPSVRRTTDVVTAANELVALVQRPVEAGGVRLRLDASSGAVMAPLHGTDADTLIRRAKSAAWAALRSRLRCTVWSPQLEQHAPTHEVALLSDIDRGLANGEFFLDYQPKLDLRDLSLAGAEALVRWRHPTRGIVPPNAFIPLIEDSTLARPFTEHVITAAVRAWRLQPALHGLRVAVNLPAVLVNDPALVESIADALVQAGAPASSLELEITERGLVAGDAVVRANLDELRNLGATLAIDDFGTGAASLSYLRWLPVESVKIDRTFVRDLAQDPVNRSVVEACVTVARALNLGVVAEGVETETEARVAAELGCTYAQGYLFGRPGPLDAVVAMAQPRP